MGLPYIYESEMGKEQTLILPVPQRILNLDKSPSLTLSTTQY